MTNFDDLIAELAPPNRRRKNKLSLLEEQRSLARKFIGALDHAHKQDLELFKIGGMCINKLKCIKQLEQKMKGYYLNINKSVIY